MQNNNFEHEGEGITEEYSEYERQQQQQRWIMIAGGLSVCFAAIAGVLFLLWRRRQPTRLDRAEASLVAAAAAAEQAARTVRQRGPTLIERGALSVEQAARTARKQGPAVIVRSGERVEQLGRTIRKRGPGMLERGALSVEQGARTFILPRQQLTGPEPENRRTENQEPD